MCFFTYFVVYVNMISSLKFTKILNIMVISDGKLNVIGVFGRKNMEKNERMYEEQILN